MERGHDFDKFHTYISKPGKGPSKKKNFFFNPDFQDTVSQCMYPARVSPPFFVPPAGKLYQDRSKHNVPTTNSPLSPLAPPWEGGASIMAGVAL